MPDLNFPFLARVDMSTQKDQEDEVSILEEDLIHSPRDLAARRALGCLLKSMPLFAVGIVVLWYLVQFHSAFGVYSYRDLTGRDAIREIHSNTGLWPLDLDKADLRVRRFPRGPLYVRISNSPETVERLKLLPSIRELDPPIMMKRTNPPSWWRDAMQRPASDFEAYYSPRGWIWIDQRDGTCYILCTFG